MGLKLWEALTFDDCILKHFNHPWSSIRICQTFFFTVTVKQVYRCIVSPKTVNQLAWEENVKLPSLANSPIPLLLWSHFTACVFLKLDDKSV